MTVESFKENPFHNQHWNELEDKGRLVEPRIVEDLINKERYLIENRWYWLSTGESDPAIKKELDSHLSDLRLLFAMHPEAREQYEDFLTNEHFNPDAPARWETFKEKFELDIPNPAIPNPEG